MMKKSRIRLKQQSPAMSRLRTAVEKSNKNQTPHDTKRTLCFTLWLRRISRILAVQQAKPIITIVAVFATYAWDLDRSKNGERWVQQKKAKTNKATQQTPPNTTNRTNLLNPSKGETVKRAPALIVSEIPRLSVHLQQHVVNEVIVKTLCSRRHCPLKQNWIPCLFVTVVFLLFHACVSRWPKIEQPKVEARPWRIGKSPIDWHGCRVGILACELVVAPIHKAPRPTVMMVGKHGTKLRLTLATVATGCFCILLSTSKTKRHSVSGKRNTITPRSAASTK